MTSTAAVQANRRNARQSTGPRTEEGKARSSMNALKHGLTAGDVVLPTEDPQAFQARLDDWNDDFPQAGAVGRCLIERAAHASWRLDRCARYETARLAHRVRHAVDRHDYEESRHAEAVGRRLLFEPLDRFAAPTLPDPTTLEKLQRRHDDHPAVLARELQTTAAGVRWLLGRWAELAEALEVRQFWHAADTYKAVRLLGRRPEDVLEDPVVGRIVMAYHVADPEPWRLYDVVREAARGCDVKAVRIAHVEAMEKSLPADPATALAFLRGLVAAEVDRLRALAPGLEALDRQDRDGAEDRAMFDPTEAGTLARRYEAASDRVLHTAIADLFRLLGPPSAPQPAAPAPPEDTPSRNEPVSEPSASPDVTPAAPAACRAAKSSRPAPRPRGPLAPSAPAPAASQSTPRGPR